MIKKESLGINWIQKCVTKYKSDPIIIEKVVRALVLLEELQKSGLKFIFKGGTSLMLMIQEPRRFSIDIDIIIEDREQDLEPKLDIVIQNTDFLKWEEHKRKHGSKIEKAHYKIHYEPQASMKGEVNNILLDIVFQKNPYTETQEIDVSHFLIMEDDSQPIKVTTPTLAAILGDKLTAYGPETTGIPLTKPKEVLKQIFDIGSIFDRIESLEHVKDNFIKVAKGELVYRDFNEDEYQFIIDDITNTSYNFCSSGKLNYKQFSEMQTGISKLSSFIYGSKFRQPEAQIAVAKASYIAKQLVLDNTKIDRFDKKIDMRKWEIKNSEYNNLNRLKKHNLEAFFYWFKIFNV